MRRVVRFNCSHHLIHQALKMPYDVTIIKIEPSDSWDTCVITIEGQQFDEIPEGANPPEVLPIVTRSEVTWTWEEVE